MQYLSFDRTLLVSVLACTMMLLLPARVTAAFMVEADPSGKANDHFVSNGASTSGFVSTAAGATALASRFAGNGTNPQTNPDRYIFSFTPGIDLPNTTFSPGAKLGDTIAFDSDGLGTAVPTFTAILLQTSGVNATGTGNYHIYITSPASTNIHGSGCRITITSDAAPIQLNPVNMNNGGTAGATGASGVNNAWLRIASGVHLTAGTTYTVTQEANSTDFVSQRSHGVMWEMIPEPASASAGLALLGVALRRRR